MDDIAGINSLKMVKSRTLASLEGVRAAEEIQITGELRELQEVQNEITHALSLMNEIREKLEVAYKELSPQD